MKTTYHSGSVCLIIAVIVLLSASCTKPKISATTKDYRDALTGTYDGPDTSYNGSMVTAAGQTSLQVVKVSGDSLALTFNSQTLNNPQWSGDSTSVLYQNWDTQGNYQLFSLYPVRHQLGIQEGRLVQSSNYVTRRALLTLR